jgi:hypothetical protein
VCFYGEQVAPGPLACALVRDTKSKNWIYFRWRGFIEVQLGFCWPIDTIDYIYSKYHLSSKLGMGHLYSFVSIGNCVGGTFHNLGISTSPWLYFSWCLKKMWLKGGICSWLSFLDHLSDNLFYILLSVFTETALKDTGQSSPFGEVGV